MSHNLVAQVEELARSTTLGMLGPDPSGELAAMRLPDLLIVLGNWRGRFVQPRPRTVHEAPELAASAKRVEHAVALQAIEVAIRSGADLTPNLTRRTKVPYVPTDIRDRRLQRREDLDLMLADWGLHHLHLSTTVEPDGYVKRTDDVLFAAFSVNDAYPVGIFPHGSWAEHEAIAIVARNWAERGIVHKLHGVLGLAQHPTPAERRSLRNAGVAVVLEIDGAVYAPAGQTTAGTPTRVTMRADEASHALEDLRRRLADSPTWLQEQLVQELGPNPPAGDWVPFVHEEEVGLLHDGSGVFVPLLRLPQ